MTRHAVVRDGKIEEFRDYAPNVDQSKLAPGKPRMLPVIVENETFDSVTQVREGPETIIEASRVVERFTVREKNTDELASMRAAKISRIKAEAERRILAIMPEYKQRNALALGVELVTAHGADPEAWPQEARTLYAALMDQWTVIKGVRSKSNAKEAAVAALATAAAIDAYDVTAGWD